MESNDAAYSLKLLKRAITGFATFDGRSRRSEIAYYWMATTLAGVPSWIVAGLLPWRGGMIFTLVVQLVLSIPIFAMFARRLHDQGLSAWGLIILPPVLAINLYEHLHFILLEPRTGALGLPELPGWMNVVWFLLILTYLIFLVLPGMEGPNSYGPDPREEHPRAASLPSADTNLSSEQ